MRFKSFLIITSTIVFSSAAFAQQDKADVVKKDSIRSTKISPRAIVEDDRDRVPTLADKMDSKKEIFYSDAPMYVAKKDASATDPVSMLILGTAKFDNKATIRQFGETSLTGDFVSVKQFADEGTATGAELEAEFKPLFPFTYSPIGGETSTVNNDGGVINFVGKWNKQKITREERERDGSGNIVLLKDKTKTHANSVYPVIHFPTIKVVKEGVVSLQEADWPVNPNTGVKLATQPEMDEFLNKRGMLEVSSNVAIGVAKLDVTGGNRFIVEAVSDGLDKGAGSGQTGKADYYKINSAYVDVRENVTKAGTHPGYHELNMQLYEFDSATNGEFDPAIPHATTDTKVQATNTYQVKRPINADPTLPVNVDATFFRGFTSPFNNLRADYMFYHVLTKPDAGGINSPHPGDGRRRPLENPETKIEPGRGYFFAMDASHEYYNNIKGNWHSSADNPAWAARERGGYNFSRLLREWKYDVINTKTKKFNLYRETDASKPVAGSTAQYEQQRFNTTGVEVDLVGANNVGGTHFYLANPFMTPISLNSLLVKDNNPQNEHTVSSPRFDVPGLNALAAYTLTPGDITAANTAGKALLRARFWVVNTGLLVHDYTGAGRYYYNVKYDVADLTTTAGTITDALSRYIEPMQMFVVQAATDGKIIFNNGLKSFQGEPFEKVFKTQAEIDDEENRTRRSTFAVAEDKYVTPDWFVIQAVVEKDGAMSADRTAVRFFNTATEGYESQHDIEKKIISEEALVKARAGNNTYADENISPTNVIYTTTPAGQPLLSNGVNYSIKEIPLHYLSGSNTNETVTLSFFGIEGFEKVPQGWLVDTHKNVKYELAEGLQYTFESTPEEGAITAKNRFLLKFYDDGTTGPTLTENPITCYYSGSTLHIGGLNEKDLGSKVYIYDLQGRLMGSTIINDYPGMEYRKVLGQGTFIVKIVGERNYGTKFVNLQNY